MRENYGTNLQGVCMMFVQGRRKMKANEEQQEQGIGNRKANANKTIR